MGLDWNININGKHYTTHNENVATVRCNGMTMDPYLDGCTAHMVIDLGLNPYYPLWPAETTNTKTPGKTEIDAEDMQIIAERICLKAECAEHIRIAAWLWTWAEADKPDNRITLYLSY
jgi:hypothetical protein